MKFNEFISECASDSVNAEPATNSEGMTWGEWFRAICFPFGEPSRGEWTRLRKAWADGEDCTEWRAYYGEQKAENFRKLQATKARK